MKLGTGLSIFISRRNPSLAASFALSCGYLLSSYHEVRSVVLNTLNRARFTVAVDSFIKTGHVPSLKEVNSQETIFNPPCRHEPVAIGSRFGDAFQEPASFVAIMPLFEDERYMVTYNPAKDRVYALLKDQAKSDDILKAAFHAHVLLHFINASHARKQMNSNPRSDHYGNLYPRSMDFLAQRHTILLGTASCAQVKSFRLSSALPERLRERIMELQEIGHFFAAFQKKVKLSIPFSILDFTLRTFGAIT